VTNASAGDAQAATQAAVETTQGQIQRNKDQLVASAEQKLRELDAKIDEFGKKLGTLTADTKAEANKALESLREKRAELGPRLEELKKASQQTWNDVKSGVETAMAELEKAYQNAKSKFGL
jgi:chromosome segregation ATPase